MKWPWRREERSVETISQAATPTEFYRFFGLDTNIDLPSVTVENALTVPAVLCATTFLSRTLASLPLHAYRVEGDAAKRLTGTLQTIVHEAPNPEWTSFDARRYFWQQLFTRGRGLFYIERAVSGQAAALWPVNVARTTVSMSGGRRVYQIDGKQYGASDVIDVPFMLRDDQCGVWSPIARCAGAIQLALAMQQYASKFFAGGGVPPLALTGPLPQGPDGLKRAMADVYRAVETAKSAEKPIFPMPPGHELKAVGIDPEKGQMTDARRFQIEEIARAFQIPPVFLQDLSKGTFANTEQQDLFFVKHLVAQWAQALEEEMNLKLFGQMNGRRYVEHNLDGLMRGDFKTRSEGLARAIQTGQLTPNEARALENRPRHSNPIADELLVQGATVPLGQEPANGGADDPGNTDTQPTA